MDDGLLPCSYEWIVVDSSSKPSGFSFCLALQSGGRFFEWKVHLGELGC